MNSVMNSVTNLATRQPSHLFAGKMALLALAIAGTALSMPSYADTLTQTSAAIEHDNKLATQQHSAEQQMADQINRDFDKKLAQREQDFMRQTCTKHGMTFDTSTNACIRS